MIWIAQILAGHGLKVAAALGLAATVATWDWRRIRAAETRGAESVRVETRKANDAAVKTSDRVRSRSAARGVRGQRDPHSID